MFAIKTHNMDETFLLAQKMAKNLQASDCLAFFADLGMGKSVLSRHIIQNYMEDLHMNIPSPTFTLVQIYDQKQPEIWHMDLYRLQEPEEAIELGIDEGINEKIMLIEWAQNLGSMLPSNAIHISIKKGDHENERIFQFQASIEQISRLFAD